MRFPNRSIILQIVAIILTSIILTFIMNLLRTSDFGFPPSPYILQNFFGHLGDSYLLNIFAVSSGRAGIRLIVACVFLEGIYWFVRRKFFLNEDSKLSNLRYLVVPALLPFFIVIRVGDAGGSGFLPLFRDITVFFNHAFIWLLAGLAIRGILCLFYGKLGKFSANIFAIIVLFVSVALFI